MRVRSSFLVGSFGNLPSMLPSRLSICHSKPSAVVHLLPGGVRLGEAQRERAVEAVVQVHRAVLELVGAGEPERAQHRRLGPLQGYRRALFVGAEGEDPRPLARGKRLFQDATRVQKAVKKAIAPKSARTGSMRPHLLWDGSFLFFVLLCLILTTRKRHADATIHETKDMYIMAECPFFWLTSRLGSLLHTRLR
jgi:hypothetical protein